VESSASAVLPGWLGRCVLSLALTALSYFVIALDLSLNAPIYFYGLEPTTIAIGYSVIGAIIASRLPYHPIGWICCAIGLTGAVEHFSSEYDCRRHRSAWMFIRRYSRATTSSTRERVADTSMPCSLPPWRMGPAMASRSGTLPIATSFCI
jgi:hypothetical protein